MDAATSRWLLPALGFVVLTGLLGVTIKLALRHVDWPVLLLWTGIVYCVLAAGALVTHQVSFGFGPGVGWAAVSGVCAAGGLICSFVALRHADAVVAVPVMSTYPVVTVVASVAVLAESLSATKVAGVLLVLAGVLVLAR
jgi:drug/metabolite transporter (DMT)-like permease